MIIDTPSHVHATQTVPRPAATVAVTLGAHGSVLVPAATQRALGVLAPLLQQGHFGRPAAPRVATEPLTTGPATIRVTWNRNDADRWPPTTPFATRPTSRWWRSDEEETGWPTAVLDLVVEPRDEGCRITAISTRTPGTDLSTNRIDRHLRDRIARAAVSEFLVALAALVLERDADAAPDPPG